MLLVPQAKTAPPAAVQQLRLGLLRSGLLLQVRADLRQKLDSCLQYLLLSLSRPVCHVPFQS
jgi:hypothetical protein